MLFTSLTFLFFFPLVAITWFIIPEKGKRLWLLLMSYVFYMGWQPRYALLLFGSTFITYLAALFIEKWREMEDNNLRVKLVFCLALVVNFGLLGYYKYTNFFYTNIVKLSKFFGAVLPEKKFDILLPVGISFFIFQAAGYLIDVWRKELPAERNFARYALFVSFFPQLVAGPIERSKNLLSQLSVLPPFEYERIRRGLLVMLWGYFLKMVIADRCALLVDKVYGNWQGYMGWPLVLATIMFAIQIYCDFMGYSTIAQGAALVLGYRLTDNFHRPYFAQSVGDFWRRWHISLSSWLRDYVYIPLGGSHEGQNKKLRNLFLTFLVSGFWHGASWNYIFWGVLHGLYLIGEAVFAPYWQKLATWWKIDRKEISYRMASMVFTFLLVDFAWLFFRAPGLKAGWQIFKRGTHILSSTTFSFGQLGINDFEFYVLVIGMVLLIAHSFAAESGKDPIDWLNDRGFLCRYAVYWLIVFLVTMSLNLSGKEFIYFQF